MALREQVADLGYAAGWALIARLPRGSAARLCRRGADWAVDRGHTGYLRSNLARVLGTTPAAVPDSLIRAAMRSYARYWQEAFQLPTADHAVLVAQCDGALSAASQQRLRDSHAAGRGVVLVLPHSGNWDLAGLWLAATFGSFTTVAERLRPESLYLRFVRYRESLGFSVLPLDGGQPPFDELVRRLAEGGIVCLLGERDLRRSGVEVDFFGHRARFAAGPAALALRTGAALHVVRCAYTQDGPALRISPALDTQSATATVASVTQDIASVMERDIAAHPADWHMLQPLWLDDLDPHRL